jgi:hypothetical protein
MRPSQFIWRINVNVLRSRLSFRLGVRVRIAQAVREAQEVELHRPVNDIRRHPVVAPLVHHRRSTGSAAVGSGSSGNGPVGAEDEVPPAQLVHIRSAKRHVDSVHGRPESEVTPVVFERAQGVQARRVGDLV